MSYDEPVRAESSGGFLLCVRRWPSRGHLWRVRCCWLVSVLALLALVGCGRDEPVVDTTPRREPTVVAPMPTSTSAPPESRVLLAPSTVVRSTPSADGQPVARWDHVVTVWARRVGSDWLEVEPTAGESRCGYPGASFAGHGFVPRTAQLETLPHPVSLERAGGDLEAEPGLAIQREKEGITIFVRQGETEWALSGTLPAVETVLRPAWRSGPTTPPRVARVFGEPHPVQPVLLSLYDRLDLPEGVRVTLQEDARFELRVACLRYRGIDRLALGRVQALKDAQRLIEDPGTGLAPHFDR